MTGLQFQRMILMPGINVIRLKDKPNILGYTIYYADEKAWVWVRKDKVSAMCYKDEQSCMEALVTAAVTERMDGEMKKLGIYDSDKYNAGRNDTNEAKL